ncbi:MAG: tRNA (cytidine(56)-2'-O)-methyltransferase [Candidatus Hydrothermarchaeota archaeon]|jgi:tRNA (cytidine56-2'-O)-methyltransferase|nr:tRNA (cytidine(56)-2'-O)-methyltransferase [Candidatus Hydrothermarchaeota archaeon]
MKAVVLRLGHRPIRDKRVTTHLSLVARAFGASGMVMEDLNEGAVEVLRDVESRWGGEFFFHEAKWRQCLRNWEGVKVHLSMYGLPLDEVMDEVVALDKDVLVVVGAGKVPGDLYDLVDYNIAVGSQPHSEISALAMFLDRLYKGEELRMDFKGKLRVIPSQKSKKVVRS